MGDGQWKMVSLLFFFRVFGFLLIRILNKSHGLWVVVVGRFTSSITNHYSNSQLSSFLRRPHSGLTDIQLSLGALKTVDCRLLTGISLFVISIVIYRHLSLETADCGQWYLSSIPSASA